MGMYNEVSKSCDKCGRIITVQISQVVYGFGNFHLDQPHEISDKLDLGERETFANRVNEEEFFCTCGWSFKPIIKVRLAEETGLIYI